MFVYSERLKPRPLSHAYHWCFPEFCWMYLIRKWHWQKVQVRSCFLRANCWDRLEHLPWQLTVNIGIQIWDATRHELARLDQNAQSGVHYERSSTADRTNHITAVLFIQRFLMHYFVCSLWSMWDYHMVSNFRVLDENNSSYIAVSLRIPLLKL